MCQIWYINIYITYFYKLVLVFFLHIYMFYVRADLRFLGLNIDIVSLVSM